MPTSRPTTWAQLADLYKAELLDVMKKYPTLYAYNAEHVPTVVDKMVAAFKAGTYSNDGKAIRQMCVKLRIKPTYNELNQLFKELE